MSRPLLGPRPRQQISVSIAAETKDQLIADTVQLKRKHPKATIGWAIDARMPKKKTAKASTPSPSLTVPKRTKPNKGQGTAK
jgi:hypothetical protein